MIEIAKLLFGNRFREDANFLLKICSVRLPAAAAMLRENGCLNKFQNSKNMKNKIAGLVLALAAAVLIAPDSAGAFVFKSGDAVNVAKDEIINETLFATGQAITVDGNVNGDVICFGQNIKINGNVEGDVLGAGQNVAVSGNVAGDIRVAGQAVEVSGKTGRNITAAGQTLTLNSEIGGEVLFAGQQANIGGKVAQNIAGTAESVAVAGQIGGNADFWVDKLLLKNGGQIGGNLNYASVNELTKEGGQVLGATARHEPRQTAAAAKPKTGQEKFGDRIVQLAFFLIIALIFTALFKKFPAKAAAAILAKPGRCALWGMLFMALALPICLILIVTLVGILIVPFYLMFMAMAAFLGLIFAARALGQKITAAYWKSKKDSAFAQIFVGVLVLWAVSLLPVIGGLAIFAAAVVGLGAWRYVFQKSKPENNAQPVLVSSVDK